MDWISENLGEILGVVTFVGGLLAWYRASVEKSYAAQRDFGHVRRSLDSLSTNMNSMKDWEDARFDGINDKLNRIEAMLSGVPRPRDEVQRRNDRE